MESQRREVRPGDQYGVAGERLILVRHARAERDVAGHIREHRLALLEIPEHPVAERDLTVTGLAARRVPGLGPGSAEVDEAAGVRDREGAEQYFIEQRENR